MGCVAWFRHGMRVVLSGWTNFVFKMVHYVFKMVHCVFRLVRCAFNVGRMVFSWSLNRKVVLDEWWRIG